MAALKSIGTLLHDSRWTSAFVEASIVTSGTAEACISVSVKRHENTASTSDHSMLSIQAEEISIWQL